MLYEPDYYEQDKQYELYEKGENKMKIQGQVRYENVITAWAYKKTPDRLQYGITILIHKDSDVIKEINKEIESVIANRFPKGKPKDYKSFFKDVAIEEPEATALKDYMQVKTSTLASIKRPILVDSNLQPIIDPSTKIVGKNVLIDIDIKAYDENLSAHLNGTMVSNEDGPIPIENLVKEVTADQMFGESVLPESAQTHAKCEQVAHVMTTSATSTYEAYKTAGWSDAQLIEKGLMESPGGVTPSFS